MSSNFDLVARLFRETKLMAVDSFRRDFPQLYKLSARAFGCAEPGIQDHQDRLGEYLTESNAALGKAPAEALAMGDLAAVRANLAERAGVDPARWKELDPPAADAIKPEPEEPRSPLAENQDANIAFCHYYATGEGVSLFVALASSREAASDLFRENTPAFFHQGLETSPVPNLDNPDVKRACTIVPEWVVDLVKTNPPGTTEFYAQVHWNLS